MTINNLMGINARTQWRFGNNGINDEMQRNFADFLMRLNSRGQSTATLDVNRQERKEEKPYKGPGMLGRATSHEVTISAFYHEDRSYLEYYKMNRQERKEEEKVSHSSNMLVNATSGEATITTFSRFMAQGVGRTPSL